MTKKEHPFADILRAIAEGEAVQYFYEGEWKDFPLDGIPGLPYALRVKPRTIRIGEYDVPEPVRKELNYGEAFYLAAPGVGGFVGRKCWEGDETDKLWLKRGLIHLDEKSAVQHAVALVSLTGML